MVGQSYIPILKTTDAELKGYSNLSDSVKDRILPLFELTKSRKTKLEPYGNIEKRMLKLKEVCGDRPFILDLTAHEDMVNYQIEALQDEEDGFQNWRSFLDDHSDYKIIPVVHIVPDDLEQTISLVKWLTDRYDRYALRVEYYDEELINYLRAIRAAEPLIEKLIVIVDAGFVDNDNLVERLEGSVQRLRESRDQGVVDMALCSSAFPKSVKGFTPECKDFEGQFQKLEQVLYERTARAVEVDVIYGDFASIHPVRYNIGGGTWVPRVDFPSHDQYIYTRYRRNAGGYKFAAEKMVAHPQYKYIDCWGGDEIEQAATAKPGGLSPSYWIAVRLNIHVTQELARLAP